MTPLYLTIAVLLLVIFALVYALSESQKHWTRVHDDLMNRLMAHTWDEYSIERRMTGPPVNSAPAPKWPAEDREDDVPGAEVDLGHPELGTVR